MTRETASLIVTALQPLLLALVAAWAAAQIRRRTQDARVLAAVDTLTRGAEGVVADLAGVVPATHAVPKPFSPRDLRAVVARVTGVT